MGHTINKKELVDFKNNEKKIFAAAPARNDGRKQLYITLNGNFEVHVNDEVIYEGNDVNMAVKTYNEEES